MLSDPRSEMPSLPIGDCCPCYLPSCHPRSLKAVEALADSPKAVAVNRALQKQALSPDRRTEGPAEDEAMAGIWSPAPCCIQTPTNSHTTEMSVKTL